MSKKSKNMFLSQTVWLVWYGEYEPHLEAVCVDEATARKFEHSLHEIYGWDTKVHVHEEEVRCDVPATQSTDPIVNMIVKKMYGE